MENITCNRCGAVNDYSTEVKANNNVATCNVCNAFIKNISYDVPRMYMGKYKGKAISEIEDIQYLKWALANMATIGKSLRSAIGNQISSLEFISK